MDETTIHGLDLEKLQDEVKEKGEELVGKAVAFAREQPHLAVAAALGLGWILGNGLSPKIVTAGARIGMKTLLGGALAGTGLAGVLGGEGIGSLLGMHEREEAPAPAPKRTRRAPKREAADTNDTTEASPRRNGNTD